MKRDSAIFSCPLTITGQEKIARVPFFLSVSLNHTAYPYVVTRSAGWRKNLPIHITV